MEKQRNNIHTTFCRRLLVLLCSLFVWLAPGNQLFAENKILYTNTDIEFSFFLPGINAADLSVIEPQSEALQNAQVRAIKKTGDGTKNDPYKIAEQITAFRKPTSKIIANNSRFFEEASP